MRKRFEMRLIFGVLIWIGIIAAAVQYSQSLSRNSSGAPAQLVQFASAQTRTIELRFEPSQTLRIGDPVFFGPIGLGKPIGRIRNVESRDSTATKDTYTDRAYVELFASAPEIHDGDTVTYHQTPESVAWVVEMMLPPETREKISGLILNAFRDHQQEIVESLRPVIEDSIRDASEVVREDLRNAFAKREDELNRIGQRFQSDLVEKELVPLVQDEIWPVIRRESQPLVNQIGHEIWDEVSVWRFTWKYLYDRSPLPERNLTEKEFNMFAEKKAIPILENHMAEIVELQQKILKDISKNDRVRATVSKSIREVAGDPEVQSLMTDVFREVFVDNQRLQDVLKENWNTPAAQRALAITNKRLDPTITEIGVTLFGSPSNQITPEFARVLRNRILHKDHRWMVIHPGENNTGTADNSVEISNGHQPEFLTVVPGETSTEMPGFSRAADNRADAGTGSESDSP